MPKLSLEERRLQILRQQLSGKAASKSASDHKNTLKLDSTVFQNPVSEASTATLKLEDTSYLFKDLKKIALLSGLAIAVQLSLFYSLQMKLIRLWF